MHTTYSDGRDSLAAMVQAAAALGYEYIAITDHSARAAAARTLTLDALERQRDEIARLRERFPALTILHGIEVDIMPDGRLDFEDEVLESLDIVLASLHDRAGHDGARLTRRCLAAIGHPLVNVITHPANRLVGRESRLRPRFPGHLRRRGRDRHRPRNRRRAQPSRHGRRARPGGGRRRRHGHHRQRLPPGRRCSTGRCGWVSGPRGAAGSKPRHVLNTRPLADVRAFIAAKRRSEVASVDAAE